MSKGRPKKLTFRGRRGEALPTTDRLARPVTLPSASKTKRVLRDRSALIAYLVNCRFPELMVVVLRPDDVEDGFDRSDRGPDESDDRDDLQDLGFFIDWDLDAERLAQQADLLSLMGSEPLGLSERDYAMVQEALRYQILLAEKSTNALRDLVLEQDDWQDSDREVAAAREQSLFFNQAVADAEYAYWMRRPWWRPEEAAALLFGKDPRIVTEAALAAHPAHSFALRFFDLLDLIARHAAIGTFGTETHIEPAKLIMWADKNHVDCAPALRDAVALKTKRRSVGPPTENAIRSYVEDKLRLALAQSFGSDTSVWPRFSRPTALAIAKHAIRMSGGGSDHQYSESELQRILFGKKSAKNSGEKTEQGLFPAELLTGMGHPGTENREKVSKILALLGIDESIA